MWPPSADSVIFTLAVLTGATSVLATFHVTVWVERRDSARPRRRGDEERPGGRREQDGRVGVVVAAARTVAGREAEVQRERVALTPAKPT